VSTVRGILEQFFRQFEASYESLNSIEVSRAAFLSNFDYLKKLYKAQNVIPVLKSNAYGHGFETILKILEDRKVPYVAVDGYHEALEVRAMSDVDVLVMATVLPENFSKIDTRHVAYVIQDMSMLNVLTNTRRALKVHLEFNTGLNRQGFDKSELKDVIRLLKDNPHIVLDGIMSHFYDAANPDRTSVDDQAKQFDEIAGKIKKAGLKPKYVHLSKTAGVYQPPSLHVNTIRPGAGLYGINPLAGSGSKALIKKFDGLMPVLAMFSRIIKIRELGAGQGVSYGHDWVAGKPTTTAIIPVGYYEGLDRRLSGQDSLRHKGQSLPIIGRIGMNHTILDISASRAKLWDKVEVISRDSQAPNSLNAWWRDHGLYPYESLVRLSPNIRRRIVN